MPGCWLAVRRTCRSTNKTVCNRTRIGIWLSAFTVGLLLAWLVYLWALHTVGSILVVEETPGRDDAILALGGDRRVEVAAKLWRQEPTHRMLLVKRPLSRVERLGIVKIPVDVAVAQLEKLGVAHQSIEILPADEDVPHPSIDAIDRWLQQDGQCRLCVLCDRFASRKMRYLFDSLLPTDRSTRITIVGLKDRRYSESDWWQHRKGGKALMFAYLSFVYNRFGADFVARPPRWDPDQYEASLRALGR